MTSVSNSIQSMMCGIVGGAALRLPALVDAQAKLVQVVGDLHARRGDPAFHVGAEGVEPLVELAAADPASPAAATPENRTC